MANWTLVQEKAADNQSSATTSTAAYTSNVTSGNLLVVAADNSSGTALSASGITDTIGSSWAKVVDVTNGSYFLMYWAKAVSSAANTVTANWSASASFPNMHIWEFSTTLSGTIGVDKTSSGTGNAGGSSVTLSSGTTATLTNATDLAVGYAGITVSISANDAAFTGSTDSAVNGNAIAWGYDVLSSTAGLSYGPTGSGNAWSSLIGTFKVTSGSTVTLPSTTMKGLFGITASSPKGLIAGGATVQLKGFFGISGQISKLAISLVNLKALLGIANAQSPGKATGQDRPYSFWGGGF